MFITQKLSLLTLVLGIWLSVVPRSSVEIPIQKNEIPMDRLVLDANVVRTALCSPDGPSAYVISKALSGDVVLLSSYPLFTEYEAFCMTQSMWKPCGLKGWQVADYLDGLAALMRQVSVPAGWLPKLRDVVSELSLLTAVQGDADAIVSLAQPQYSDVCEQYDLALLSPQQVVRRIDHV